VAERLAPGALVLAIDAVADSAAVLVARDGAEVASRAWSVQTTMSRELLEAVDGVLREAGVAPADLGGIAVDVGPGQYGALRTGIATAQGLALALGVPLAGIGRLEAEAFAHLARGRPAVAVHDAGRSGIAWAAYAAVEAGAPPRVLVAPRLDPPATVAREAPRGAIWCGEVTEALAAARDAEGASGDTEGPNAAARARALVALAEVHAAYGDPALVDAVYLRPPPITKPV
jgi:tRNA threonylcarbamoyl adenosine modification protein YeaZ